MEFKKQTERELETNYERIKNIIEDSNGDKEKQIKAAKSQAKKITKPEKAYNRGYAAKELGYEHIFEVYYERAFELNAVDTAEIREYNIKKILGDD